LGKSGLGWTWGNGGGENVTILWTYFMDGS